VVNGNSGLLNGETPLTINGVTIATTIQTLGPIAVIIFRAVNSNSAVRNLSLAVSADLKIDGLDAAPCFTFPDGFDAQGPRATVRFHCKNHPLGHDVDAFWFGDYTGRSSNLWTQVSASSFTGDSAMSVSWQNRRIGPEEKMTLSVVLSWAIETTPPIIDMSTTVFPSVLELDSSISLHGSAIDAKGGDLSIFAVIDDEFTRFAFLETNLKSGSNFNCSVKCRDWTRVPGDHAVAIYAIGTNGTVTDDPARFSFSCVAPTPTRTLSAPLSPTRSPISTPLPTARPSRTPKPYMVMSFTADNSLSNLDLFGAINANPVVTITNGGFSTFVKSANLSDSLFELQFHKFDALRLKIEPKVAVAGLAAIVSIRVINAAAVDQLASVSIQALLKINNASSTSCEDSQGNGFSVMGNGQSVNFICRNHPMVVDVDGYWFGASIGRFSFNWSRLSMDFFESLDPAISISWHNFTIPAHSWTVVSAVVRLGEGSAPPVLELTSIIPDHVDFIDILEFSGYVNDPDDDRVSILLVIDQVYTKIVTLVDDRLSGPFRAEMLVDDLDILEGPHQLELYAIDSTGMFSAPCSFNTTVQFALRSSKTPRPTAVATASLLPPTGSFTSCHEIQMHRHFIKMALFTGFIWMMAATAG
jgi:hypothetical protein